MVQTNWQCNMFRKYGGAILCIDATHNVTMYENLNLTTLVVRDKWKHGIPVAWMLASSGTESTIHYFLKLNQARSPAIIPRYIMTDFDWAEINACAAVYRAWILLCWWHVLHAWQQHLRIQDHSDLWTLLKKWIRITDEAKFRATWVKIQAIAPPKFTEYLKNTWMPDRIVRMWSAVYRTEQSIFEACDTNMLVEAYVPIDIAFVLGQHLTPRSWHHVLKGKFLDGKRNRRLDHLINVLVARVAGYYALKQRRQELGFEGPDIEVLKRRKILEKSEFYTKEHVEHVEDSRYLVQSESDPSKYYEVDVEAYTCPCLDYPLICFCKHLCAVQRLFDEQGPTEQLPAFSSIQANTTLPLIPAADSTASPCTPVSKPKSHGIHLAEKLERLAARLRRPSSKTSDPAVVSLEPGLDAALVATDTGAVLPSATFVAPNDKSSWQKTKGQMLPRTKIKRRKGGDNVDAAYGAGGSSGLKAKDAKLTGVQCVISFLLGSWH
jgi:hypothetical protein